MRLQREALNSLDTWIAQQPEPKPSRPEAIRTALKDWLSRHRYERFAHIKTGPVEG